MELTSEDAELSPDARLGRRVRSLREGKGLSLRQLSEKVGGYSHSYLGRVELGKQPASAGLIARLDTYFETDGVLAELHGLAQDVLVARYSRHFVRKERDSLRIQVFTSSVIPGLLQTKEYAHELFRTGLPASSADQLSVKVDARLNRQGIFDRDEPPYYWAIMDEASLRRPTRDKGIMKRQLEHILAFSERSRVTVQVLPFDQGFHPMLGGSLTLLTLKDGGRAALVESFDSGDVVESPRQIVDLVQRFDIACAMALPDHESADLMRRYLEEYTHGG
ncbi:helix-turn-helix transcriptional regulator [Streptomyces sp. PT12]|uniref:helix-turn-helix domain-containing protein n=1 Tax=Streptomyces sp. PT12 TaxID=1510197 RepID=UPI000DE41761|nr:helix-turn-helix transcriptional regulator [Streptomyces sp. PT12]RBM07328.1 DNA-binding protein [Streptomyces sp. PT12]